jgi:uncharacterized repeat protein (TIGR01451 family)
LEEEVHAAPGDVVQWVLRVKDNAHRSFTRVTVRDVLPPHVRLVAGSVRLAGQTGEYAQRDTPLFGAGLITGSYDPGGARYLLWDGVIEPDFTGCAVGIENIALVSADNMPEQPRDSATVVQVGKQGC